MKVDKPKSFKCATFAASPLPLRHLATGDFDGTLQLWDLEKSENPVYSAKAHSSIINAIDGVGGLNTGQGPAELVTSGRDGVVKIWDVRQKDSAVAVIEPEQGQRHYDCWSVAFGNAHSSNDRMVINLL